MRLTTPLKTQEINNLTLVKPKGSTVHMHACMHMHMHTQTHKTIIITTKICKELAIIGH